MDFADLAHRLTGAAAKGDGSGVGDCFTEDGVYHDVFYGAFQGRAAIADMIENHFHRDAQDFRWDLHDPVAVGDRGYARYVFSYTSRLDGYQGKRAIFEGVLCCRLANGLISEYREVANAATGLSAIGFDDKRVARFVRKELDALRNRPEAAAHLAGSAT